MRLRRKPVTGPAALTLAGVTLAACSAEAQEDWTKRFRVGASFAFNIKADFTTGGAFNVPGTGAGDPGVSGQDHYYDDGYVRVDDTGNAQGLTSFWGYEDAAQHDPIDNTLTFQSTTSFASQQGIATEDDSPFYGFDMAYGTTIREWGGAAIGWELGFTFMPMTIKNSGSSRAIGARTAHQFDTGGIVLPQAPYDGGSSGTGALINDVATELPGDVALGTLNGSQELKSNLYNIRLGANSRWHLGGRWSVSAGLGFACGVVTSDYSFNETLVYDLGGTSNFSGNSSSTDFVVGGYGEAMVYWQAEKSGEIYLGAQYMGMTSANASDQGRNANLDLSGGIYATVGFHWAF